MSRLKPLDSLLISTVLEDCVDQLAILGCIMPNTYEGRPNAEEIVGDDISRIIDSQKQLGNRYETLIGKRKELRGGSKANIDKLQENVTEIEGVVAGIRSTTQNFTKGLKQSPLTADNLQKTQADRLFLEDVIYNALCEIHEEQTYDSLIESVSEEQSKKARLQNMILKEEAGRKRIKQLHRQLVDVKREQETEIQQRSEMIAHLKDQLQEMKAKSNMEGKYVKKGAEVTVNQTQKKCSLTEKDMKQEIDRVHRQIEEEERVNQEIEQYLKTHHVDLEEKLEYWMEKYDTDVETKQHELDVLKASKANDLARLQELTKTYAEYEQVVVEDRIEKEKARRLAEQEAEELKATVKVQSWWRGIMVRKQLGPYSKKKKKKGKKGKKSGKKGKKKKK
ncbi:dynein regulatory complex protein 9-like [Saccoglossus kowalevskii]|uniref:Dynein regulatory complex protein 9 n=1 Tax=Saccoglossus kowalevskii TaxID=10224 RepID=A0ABM0GWG4_SACKO|nr:PREDICTED: IQ domain-containing protein G-like [Saccoglossus kowalevskii]